MNQIAPIAPSGERQATAALHRALGGAHAPVHAAGGAFVKACLAAAESAGLVETMRHAVALALAAEHLKRVAGEAEDAARQALAAAMNDTGCARVLAAGQLAYLSHRPAFVSVDRADQVPPEYLAQPAPAPDKRRIKAALEAGASVPGCALVRPNDYALCIKARKE